jgi:hypothetical protein
MPTNFADMLDQAREALERQIDAEPGHPRYQAECEVTLDDDSRIIVTLDVKFLPKPTAVEGGSVEGARPVWCIEPEADS